MRICIDLRMISESGIGTYIRSILPRIGFDSIDVFFLVFKKKDLTKVHELGISATIINMKYGVYSPLSFIELFLKVPRVDLYWSPHFVMPFVTLRSIHKKVVTIHDVFHLTEYAEFGALKSLYIRLLYLNAVKSQEVITVSNFSKLEIARLLNRDERVTVSYNGVELNNSSKKFNDEIQLPDKYLLFVGNVKPHKNLIVALQAFEEVVKKNKDLYFVIVGRKGKFITNDDKITNLIKGRKLLSKKVVFTGYIPDEYLPIVYKNALILLFPSLYEGFGLPPLEALKCGTLSILSDIPILREIYGDNGYYFDASSHLQLANLIEQTLNEKPSQIEKKLEIAGEKMNQYKWSLSAKIHKGILFNHSK